MKKSVFGFTVNDMTEISLLIAIAILLDKFVKIGIGSTGGSLNISMFPLFVISLRHGPFKSFVAGGIVFGLITCLLDGYGLVTYPLEYLISFGSVALLGFFAKWINDKLFINDKKNWFYVYLVVISCVVCCVLIRLLCATIDSILIYNYEFVSALLYNISYIIPSALLVLVLVCIFLPYIKNINKLHKSSYFMDN